MGTHYNVRNVEWGNGGKPPFQPPKRILMRKSSITLKHFKEVQVHHFIHNSREKPTSNSIFSTENNYTNKDYKSSIKSFWKYFNERVKKYTAQTGKKLPKNTIKHISGIFNITDTTTKEQVEKVIKYLEESLDTKVIQYSIHKDEGYIDPDTGEKKINYHVHIEMLGLDSNGRSVRKKIDRKYLINLQTEVSKILNMERGESVKKTRRKRLDTHEYKRHKKLEEETIKQLKTEIKELKQENEKLKEELEITKEEIKKNNRLLKDIRNYIKTINKGLELFVKEDYQEITKIQKELRKYNYTTLTELRENINKLIKYYQQKIESTNRLSSVEKEKIVDNLYSYLE